MAIHSIEVAFLRVAVLGTRLISPVDNKMSTLDLFHNLMRIIDCSSEDKERYLHEKVI